MWIAPGKFITGCSPGDGECFDEEKPAHEVTVTKGFLDRRDAGDAGGLSTRLCKQSEQLQGPVELR